MGITINVHWELFTSVYTANNVLDSRATELLGIKSSVIREINQITETNFQTSSALTSHREHRT